VPVIVTGEETKYNLLKEVDDILPSLLAEYLPNRCAIIGGADKILCLTA